MTPTGLYWPKPIAVEGNAQGVPLSVTGIAIDAIREEWLVEDR